MAKKSAKEQKKADNKADNKEPETDANSGVDVKEGEPEDFGFDGQYDTLEAFDAPDPDFESRYDEDGNVRVEGQKEDRKGPRFSASRQFIGWLRDQKIGILATSYTSGQVFIFCLQKNGRLLAMNRPLPNCTAVATIRNGFFATSDTQLWRFENLLAPGQDLQGFDKVYLPRNAHVFGGLHVHDMGIARSGRPILLSTMFNCLATVEPDSSFLPLWKPKFITKLLRQDKCHLSGLAMHDGRPKYVTAFAESDENEGWKNKLKNGGIVIDVPSNEIVARGLGMPHSPRLYRGKLWLLDSASGYFGSLDPDTGKFEPMTFCNGFPRGLAFFGNFALIGLSRPREEDSFKGLPLGEELKKRKVEPKCGVSVIDLRTGDQVHWMRIENGIDEMYNLSVIPQVRSARIVGLQGPEVQNVVKVGQPKKPQGQAQQRPQQRQAARQPT